MMIILIYNVYITFICMYVFGKEIDYKSFSDVKLR